jgi:hypothetical protein
MRDYELLYETFWKDIIEEEGALNIDQVKRELFDFHQLIVNIPKIFDHITGGACTKPLTDVSVVCSLADEYYTELHTMEAEE